MRITSSLVALPALAHAQQQIPMMDQVKGWFAKASSSITSALPSVQSLTSPVDPVASTAHSLVELPVANLTQDSWRDALELSPGGDPWMVFVTGANATCRGRCERAEQAWNASLLLLAAAPAPPPRLALIDCEPEPELCLSWSVRPPSVLHFQPAPPGAAIGAPTTFRHIPLNHTTVTGPAIAALHLADAHAATPPYTGIYHPVDGLVARAGLQRPVGLALWAVNQVPSWAIMVAVSMVTRMVISRRNQPNLANLGGAPPPRVINKPVAAGPPQTRARAAKA